MKRGPKPKHAFNTLKIGEKALLKGKAKIYYHQFIGQFNRTREEKLKIVKENGKIFAERIS